MLKEALVATNSLRILTRLDRFLFFLFSFVLDVLSSFILLFNSHDNDSHDPKLFNIRKLLLLSFGLIERLIAAENAYCAFKQPMQTRQSVKNRPKKMKYDGNVSL